jgi:hypothetical protein
MKIFNYLRCFCLLPLFLTAACGGGGGGGESEGGGSNNSSGLSISRNSVSFATGINDPTPDSVIITGSVTGIDRSVRVDIVFQGTVIEHTEFEFTSGTSGALTIRPHSPYNLGTGIKTDLITVYACFNPNDCTGGQSPVPGSPKIIDVTYTITAAVNQLNYVAPFVGEPNSQREVYLRGYGFSKTASPSVFFGGTSATSVDVINDTTIKAGQPALVEGEYEVEIVDAAQSYPSTAKVLIKQQATVFPTVRFTDSNVPPKDYTTYKLIYDPTRDALFGTHLDNTIHKYTFTGSEWSFTEYDVPRTGINTIAFSPDFSELIVTGGVYFDGFIDHYNPDTMTRTASISIRGEYYYPANIQIANNGIAVINEDNNHSYRYNIKTHQIVEFDTSESAGTGFEMAISGDGNIIAAPHSGFYIPQYNAITDQAVVSSQLYGPHTGGSSMGNVFLGYDDSTRVEQEGEFYGSAYHVIQNSVLAGTIIPDSSSPPSGIPYRHSGALSPDSLRFYITQANFVDTDPKSLYIYDLTSPDNGSFTQTPESPVDISVLDAGSEAIVTPNGKNLIFSVEGGISVFEIP